MKITNMATNLTKENNEGVHCFYHKAAKNPDKSRLRARRNGKTKYWKTRPDNFKIPVKYGLYQYFYIDENNANEWTID